MTAYKWQTLGALLLEVPREKGGRPKETGGPGSPSSLTQLQQTHIELGITKKTALKWQTLAKLDETLVEQWMADMRLAALLLEAPREKPGPRAKEIGKAGFTYLQAVYAELGITKMTAHKWQTLAKLDETLVEQWMADMKLARKQITQHIDHAANTYIQALSAHPPREIPLLLISTIAKHLYTSI